jgi:hypothetical protein
VGNALGGVDGAAYGGASEYAISAARANVLGDANGAAEVMH